MCVCVRARARVYYTHTHLHTHTHTHAELLHKFMKDPSKYLEGVLLGARKAPELINLLNLEASFPHNVLKRFLTPFGASADSLGLAKTSEIDCQVCVCVGMCVCVCVCARARTRLCEVVRRFQEPARKLWEASLG